MLEKTEATALEMPVEAVRVTTGVGKTQIMVQTIANSTIEARRAGHTPNPWLYVVPTHRLGEDIVALFANHGLKARIFRGRAAAVPGGKPGETMCQNLDQVKLALACGVAVSQTCCKAKQHRCPLFSVCRYQQQTEGPKPDVWVAAHETLFHGQKALGQLVGVVVDESFWQDGIRIGQSEIEIHEIATSLIPPAGKENQAADLDGLRNKLATALLQDAGGVARAHIVDALTRENCTEAIRLEWVLAPKAEIYPGMTRDAFRTVEAKVAAIRFARNLIAIWGAARDLIDHPEIEISGRLYLEEANGRQVVKWRGAAPIREQYKVPTMLMDATLPDLSILRAYYPTWNWLPTWKNQCPTLPCASCSTPRSRQPGCSRPQAT